MMKEQWKKEMQEKLSEYRQAAPEVSWPELSRAIPKGYRRSVPAWIRTAAVAAALVAVAGIGFKISMKDSRPGGSGDGLAEIPGIEATSPAMEPDAGIGLAQASPPVQVQGRSQGGVQDRTGGRAKAEVQQRAKSSVESGVEDGLRGSVQKGVLDDGRDAKPLAADPVQVSEGEVQVKVDVDVPGKSPQAGQSPARPQETPFRPVRDNRGRGMRRLTAKAYLSNASGCSNTSVPTLMAASPYGQKGMEPDYQRVYELRTTTQNDAHHRQPIRIGLSLRYGLDNRWSLESGLSYSLLASQFDMKVAEFSYETDQRLSYIGIPLNLSYRIVGGRHFNLYASGGGMVEKMVKGTSTMRTMLGSKTVESHGTESVSIRPLQFSVNASLGAEFKLAENLGIFFEPGARYNFASGSDVRTIYKDKPLDFNLSLGFRFNL